MQLVRRYPGTDGVRVSVRSPSGCCRTAGPARAPRRGRQRLAEPRGLRQPPGSAAPAPSDPLLFQEEASPPRSEHGRAPSERAGCSPGRARGWHSRPITARSPRWPVARGAARAPRGHPGCTREAMGEKNHGKQIKTKSLHLREIVLGQDLWV